MSKFSVASRACSRKPPAEVWSAPYFLFLRIAESYKTDRPPQPGPAVVWHSGVTLMPGNDGIQHVTNTKVHNVRKQTYKMNLLAGRQDGTRFLGSNGWPDLYSETQHHQARSRQPRLRPLLQPPKLKQPKSTRGSRSLTVDGEHGSTECYRRTDGRTDKWMDGQV